MSWLSELTVFAVMPGALACSASAESVDPMTGGVTIVSSKAKIQNGDCFSFNADVRMEAPPAQVYDALARPENWRRVLRIIESPDHRSKILEFDLVGSKMEPPRDQYVVYRVQYLFDPQKLTVSAQMLNDKPLPWNEYYSLSSLENGSETLLGYRSWQCEPQRSGDKPRDEEDLARGLSVGLQFRLQNIERGIRYTGGPAVPQIRNGQRVYPTAIATPAPSQQ